MCEANAYLVDDEGQEELVMERVDSIVHGEGGLVLRSIFGEQKLIKAQIRELALVNHRIILARSE